MTLKDNLINGTLAISLIAIILAFPKNNTNNANTLDVRVKDVKAESRIYGQFKEKADANHDGHLTESELIPIYDVLKLKYDARKPDNLTEEQIKKYIDIKNRSSDYSY